MPRIITHTPGVVNLKAGFHAVQPGEYDYPDEPRFRGWLDGQLARGNASLVPQVDPYDASALGPTSGSTAGESEPDPDDPGRFAPGAMGLTSGSTPGEAAPELTEAEDEALAEAAQHPEGKRPDAPGQFAPGAAGLTAGSTPGPAPAVPDEAQDQQDAAATQHPETVERARAQAGRGSRGRGR